jgi:MFS family permease
VRRVLILSPNVFFLGLVSLFNDFSAEMIYAVMPAFLTVVLGAPPIFLGFLEGFADALASLLKIFSGWFSDKIKKRKIVAFYGYSLSVSVRWILAFVTHFWHVFFLRVIDRTGKGIRDSARDALLAESVEKKELGKSFGYHRMMDAIGATLGPLAAVIILPFIANDYRQLFIIAFALGLLAVITFLFVREPKREIKIEQPITPFSFSLKKFSRDFKILIFSIFIFGLGVMPMAMMLLKVTDAGLKATLIPMLYFIYNISFVLAAIPFGKLSDKIGQKKVLIGGFLMAIFAYLILANVTALAAIIIGFIIFGFYSAMTDGIGRALTSKLEPNQLASAQGFLAAAIGISSLLAGVIGGAIWTFVGAKIAFVYGASLMLIGLLVFLGIGRRINDRRVGAS